MPTSGVDTGDEESESWETWEFLDHNKVMSMRKSPKLALEKEETQSATGNDSVAVHARGHPQHAPGSVDPGTHQTNRFLIQPVDTVDQLSFSPDRNPILPLERAPYESTQTDYSSSFNQPYQSTTDMERKYSAPDVWTFKYGPEHGVDSGRPDFTSSSDEEEGESIEGLKDPGSCSSRTGPSSKLLQSLTPCV